MNKKQISTIERLRRFRPGSLYLDASFDNRDVHELFIRPLTKEQALGEYRKSGGKTGIWPHVEKNMPYVVPRAIMLYVMLLDFTTWEESINSDGILIKMDKLGVRPILYEELIQYGVKYPKHQTRWIEHEAVELIALGSRGLLKESLYGGRNSSQVTYLGNGWQERKLYATEWSCDWGFRNRVHGAPRFLVVPK